MWGAARTGSNVREAGSASVLMYFYLRLKTHIVCEFLIKKKKIENTLGFYWETRISVLSKFD